MADVTYVETDMTTRTMHGANRVAEQHLQHYNRQVLYLVLSSTMIVRVLWTMGNEWFEKPHLM